MRSVTYVAAYDPYHAMFRILALLSLKPSPALQLEAARILDFYVCYPWLAREFKASRDTSGQVRASNALKKVHSPSPYQVAPDPRSIYRKMRPSQLAAMSSLASKGLVNRDGLAGGILTRTAGSIPGPVATAIAGEHQANPELYAFLSSIMTLPVNGSSGLKSRSGLEEFRYDNV